ncbi:MAG: acyl-CoA dehydrogenase family protein, partial [Acidimicrobiia bacterium]
MADPQAAQGELSLGRPTARVRALLGRLDQFVTEELEPLQRKLTESGLAELLDPDGSLPRPVWEARREVARRSASAGLYAAHLPEDMGGAGLSRYEMQFLEEAVYRRGLGLAPSMLAWTEGPSPMLAWLDSSQRERFLVPLVAGETSAAFANTEPGAGSDVLGLTTTARRSGDDWVIDGHKAWITNAPFCDLVQVTAVTEPGAGTRSLTLFLVEADRPGFSRGPTYRTIMDDGLTGELMFDGVRVPDANRV